MALTKVTLNLSERTSDALDRGTVQSNQTKTAFINRAVQLYEFVLQQEAAGRTLWVRDGDSMVQVKML